MLRGTVPLKDIEYGVYYWDYIGIMEKKMETTILQEGIYIGVIVPLK